MEPRPPHYALRFLRWFCRDDYLEEIEGNLLELYDKQHQDSPTNARRMFYWNVLRHFRPTFIRSFKLYQPANHRAMIHHNFLLTFRNFKRYKSTFLINLVGLSLGLACVLLISLWVQDELSVDKFHANDAQLYQILEHREQPDGITLSQRTSGPAADALAEEMPEVIAATTVYSEESSLLSIEDRTIEARGQFVGHDFFTMFSYDIIQGDPTQVLSDKRAIVVSESLAKRLFGTTTDAIGKTVERKFDQTYQVSGVFKDVPVNSTVRFDFILSFETYRDEHDWATDWGTAWPYTYVLLQPGTNVEAFNQKIAGLVETKTNGQDAHRTMFAASYSDLYLYGNYENGKQAGGRITYVRLFSAIAIFILLIACINFMNLSTAKASRRTKEVGVKKAIGAHRLSLVAQYLSESIVIAFLSLAVAVLIAALLLPLFNTISGKQLVLTTSLPLVLSALGIAFITGVLAGSYPALYLSGFNPALMLRGKLNRSMGEAWTRQGLVVLQFVMSTILITSVWVVYQQVAFIQNKHLGYDRNNIIFFEWLGEEGRDIDPFLAEIRKIPEVTHASSTSHNLVGHQMSTYNVQWPGRGPNDKTEFEFAFINYGVLELLNVNFREGRSFRKDFRADAASIILNEAAIDHIGLSDPIGKTIEVWGENREIIGVVRDFHFESLHETIKPLFFVIAPERTWDIAARIDAGKEREAIKQLAQLSGTFFPGLPFDYQFLDEDHQTLYVAEQRISTLSKYFAGLAIFISCLGLFGLAAFTAERRLKEIGIRKALGASATSIVGLLTGGFTKMVLVAIGIALPLSYLAAQRWLQNFAFHIDLQWWYFAGAGLLALLIAWFTLGLQTVKAARVNPVECLRDE